MIPETYWKIDAYTNGYTVVIIGVPPNLPEDNPLSHNCDAMGCGSVGPHVIARIPIMGIPIMAPTPEIYWNNHKHQTKNMTPIDPELGW